MTRLPFLIAPEAIDGTVVTLHDEQAHRVRHALRMQPGDALEVGDGAGTVHDVVLDAFERSTVRGSIRESRTAPPEPTPHVELVQVLSKPHLAERVLAPCTTLGVTAFRFAPGERTPVGGGEAEWGSRLERWGRIIRQAAEQSGRAWLPECACYDTLTACFEARAAGVRLVGDEALVGTKDGRLHAALADARAADVVQWVIGPEGGFSDAERARFPEWGLRPVSLGGHVLRLETAAAVGIALTQYELGRLG